MWEPVARQTRQIPRRLRRLFNAIPMIWTNEDWDAEYMLGMMLWKLKRVRACIAESGRNLGWEKDCKSMDEAIALLEKIAADDYMTEEHADLLDKWWKSKTEVELENGMTRMDFPEDKESDEAREWHSKDEAKRRKADWNRLFLILKRDIRNWWD